MSANLNASPINSLDTGALEARLVNALNEAAMLQLISLGHRTGLLNALADGEPVTSRELADKSALDERYVREWLGGLSVAGLLQHQPENMTYRLPQAFEALLTDGGEANLAVYSQYLPLLGTVEDDVVSCFRRGGGVPYDRYARFHDVMVEDSGQTVLPSLFDSILPLAPGLIERLERGIDVVDVRHEQVAAHAADGYARITGKQAEPFCTHPGNTCGVAYR